MTSIAIHPAVDSGFRATDAAFAGGTLVCKCASNPVKVRIKAVESTTASLSPFSRTSTLSVGATA
ncbi:hypothetical protein ACC728_37880, partial [Rhizobium ruizarguesonis]